jgi:hypothetical protein
MMSVQAITKQKKGVAYGRESSTYKMVVQVSHSVHPEIQKENNIQPTADRYKGDNKRFM